MMMIPRMARTVLAVLFLLVAMTSLAHADIRNGVDRVVAVLEDGRAFTWHQLNESADK